MSQALRLRLLTPPPLRGTSPRFAQGGSKEVGDEGVRYRPLSFRHAAKSFSDCSLVGG